MEKVVLAVMLLGFHSEVISGSSPEADPLKRHDESAKNLKDLFRRDEYDENDKCMRAIMCITSPDLRLFSGNVYEGLQFSMGGFNGYCRGAKEYLTCYDEAAKEYICGYESTMYANLSRAMRNHFCEDSSVIQSMVQCFNKRSIQTMAFGEFKEHLGWDLAFRYIGDKITSDEKIEKMCRLQSNHFLMVLNDIGYACGSDEYTYLCNIFTDPTIVQLLESTFGYENCPIDTYSLCRYSYSYYNWPELK